MTWYRIFRTNSNKKSKLSVVEFDQHIEPIPTCLKQSPVYQHHLVQIHSIVQTYVNLVTMKKRRRQSSQDWTLMETFIKLWYSELERIYKHASGVAVMLKGQINELCTALYSISFPSRNRDKKLVHEVRQFISNCLKDLDHSFNKRRSLPTPKSMHNHFQTFHYTLENRMQAIRNEKQHSPLVKYMNRVYQLEQDIFLHHYYIESQLKLLWDLGHIALRSPLLATYWNQKYETSQQMSQDLLNELKTALEQQLPCQRDVMCAICLSILHEPVTLKGCHHTFCKDCLQQHYCYQCSAKKKKGFLLVKAPLIGCSCFILDEHGQLVPAHHQSCPLCRQSFKPEDCELNVDLEKFILERFKQDLEDRKRESKSY